MTIAPGQALLHYRLVEKIGEGGMGEVWKAVDTGLGREVAIKLLPEAFAADVERLARFEREAKLLAALKHPGIAVVHGLHEAEGRRFLAMELAEGEDLARRLARGALSVEDTVAVGRRVAEALEAAHEHGVVHRDLKPANIQVDPEGAVKVLDFGLAKALEHEGRSADSSLSPTVTSVPTAAGLLLGTAAYMSPEQARGLAVDKRTDVWAFGCVLYEALCGRHAFEGDTITDTLAAVLRGEPDWSALPAGIPAALRALIGRCLTKDKARRLRDVGEARIVLEDLERGTAERAPAESVRPAARPRRGPLALGVALLAAIAFVAGWLAHRPAAPVEGGIASDVRVRRVTSDPGLEDEPALSPEGNYVAYATDDRGQLDVVVQQLGGGSLTRVADSPADDAQPAWSPDGSRLAFVSARDRSGRLAAISNLGPLSKAVYGFGGDIFLAPALGGTAVKLVEDGCYPAWSPDGTSIVYQALRDDRWDLWAVPAAGGTPRRITDDEAADYQPSWSPDGKWIAYGSMRELEGLRVVAAGGGRPFPMTEPEESLVLGPAWSPDGRFIYFSSDRTGTRGEMNLWRVRFDGGPPARFPVPERVTLGEGSDIGVDVARDGRRLAYSAVRFKPDIWQLDLASGEMREVVGTPGDEDFAHVAPDGHRMVLESDRGGSELALWIYDMVDHGWSQLTPGGIGSEPRWSPDGRRVAFNHWGEAIAVQEIGAVAARDVITMGDQETVFAPEWSPDGTHIAATVTRTVNSDIRVWTAEGGDETRIVSLPGGNGFPAWSPDGKTIAFQHEHEAPRQIWLVPAAGGEPRALTHDDVEYSHPQWNPRDADRILIVINHEDLGVVHVADGRVEKLTSFGKSTVLVDYPSWSPDGAKVYFSLARKTGDVFMLEDY